jgi:dihydroflavonol-4-reductase
MEHITESPETQTVLVTGGSGFVGGRAVVSLLNRGYRVRTTIRSLARESQTREMIGTEAEAGDLLSVVAANLLDDAGWDEATDGVDYVLHVASPMPIGEYRGQDVITPARMGTMRVLEASLRNGVKRVVYTGSTAAASSKDKSVIADETVWTDLPDDPIYNYPRSKTLAEQDAWAFIKGAEGRMELVTVLPANIQGPVLGSDYSASVGMIQMMLKGKLPVLPQIGYGVVDVRDLIDLHILAMTSPVAANERFIASGEFLWLRDMAQILKDNLGKDAAKVSTRNLPNFVARFGALFNPELKQMAPSLGVKSLSSSAKAERLLGWKTRQASQSVLDAARSLITKGLV